MTAPKKFSPPTLDEWMFYADSIGWMPREDAEAAYDHYLSVGWKVGGQPMRDWQAAARNCKRRSCRSDGAFRGGRSTHTQAGLRPTLGALQMQRKAIEEELSELLRPGGTAWNRTLTLEQSEQAERLRAQLKAVKERIACL